MHNRIVEIASDRIHLSLKRGFLKLSQNGSEIGEVPLPDIGAVIVRGYGASLSLNLAARLAELNVPIILCDTKQSPASIIWPLNGHHAQGHIIQAQAEAGKPLQKRLWQALVKAKIRAQAQALKLNDEVYQDLVEIAGRIRSGDPDNQEAMAARRYWPRMLGRVEEDFKRNQKGDGLNGALNYGYTVLRAAAARSILSAGLHPSLSIHHISRGEALRLASDIMEPFRPWVDFTVRRLASTLNLDEPFILSADSKLLLTQVLTLDLKTTYGTSPIQVCLDRLCQSLADVYCGERRNLELPGGPVLAGRTYGVKA